MKRIKLVYLLIALIISSIVTAQSTINSVENLKLKNFNVITKGDKTTGYCFLYKADKIKGVSKDYSYRINILDEKGELVAEKSIIASKYLFLIESAYNEELLCLKFYDAKKFEVMLEFYDNNAELVYSDSYHADMMERAVLNSIMNSNSNMNMTLHSVPNKGFLHYKMINYKKLGYEISYYPNDEDAIGWTVGSDEQSDFIETATLLQATDEIILNTVIKKKTLMTKKMDYWLLALNTETGEEVFNIKLENSEYEEDLMNSFYDKKNNELKLFGNYYNQGDKTIKDRSLGLSMTTMTLDGKIKDKKYLSWNEDIAEILPTDSKGRIDKVGYIFFHRFIQKSDGTIFAIGESYKTPLNKAVIVDDFYFFELTPDFELKDVKVFKKFPTTTTFPGIPLSSPKIVALMTYASGGFDFSYVKDINNGETFSVFYQDYEIRSGEKNRSIVGAISNTDGEYTEDKLNINTSANFVKILPAHAGNVLFLEYFKKTKELKWRFEKLNY